MVEWLEIEINEIDIEWDFIDYGFNLIEVVNLFGELENFLGWWFFFILLLDYFIIEFLVEYLVEDIFEDIGLNFYKKLENEVEVLIFNLIMEIEEIFLEYYSFDFYLEYL